MKKPLAKARDFLFSEELGVRSEEFRGEADYNKVVGMRSLAVLPLAGGRGTTFYLI